MNTNLEKQLAVEKERADYAWKNTCSIDAARQKEMSRRDAADHEVAVLREALELCRVALRNAQAGHPCPLYEEALTAIEELKAKVGAGRTANV